MKYLPMRSSGCAGIFTFKSLRRTGAGGRRPPDEPAIVAAVANGELTPSEASELTKLVEGFARVLEIYDHHCWGIAKDYSKDQIGAVSLLARMEIAGIDVGDRWRDLSAHLAARAHDTVLPFLTLQYLYGLARAGREEAAVLLELRPNNLSLTLAIHRTAMAAMNSPTSFQHRMPRLCWST